MSSRQQPTNDGDKIPEIQVIQFPTDQIDPSPFQARKRFEEEGILEIGDSIRRVGVLQPLIVRAANPASGRLELIAGERRWRGAKAIGLAFVPVIVRELSDADADEVMLIENLQREDLTESEEAYSLDRMLKLKEEDGTPRYTVKTLAEKLSKDISHVTARLKLLLCPKELIAAVDKGPVSVTTAMLVGRIPDPKARAECAREVLTPSHQEVPLNYEQTKELIRSRYIVRLDKKDFPLDDEMLVPVKKDDAGQRCLGGACTDCPFRSGNLEGVDVATVASAPGKAGGGTRGVDPNMCTLPKCHKLKLDAAWRSQKELAQIADRKVLDGEAAEKAFAGHNGDLVFDGDYVDPAAPVNLVFGGTLMTKSWKEALKGVDIETVLARHPETKKVMQLYDREEAAGALVKLVEAEKAQAQAKPDDQPQGESADEEQARAEAEKQARAKEKEQVEVDKLALWEAVGEIINGVTSKGVALEFYRSIFQMALKHSGADGMHFLGNYLEIEMPKGSHSGRDYEPEIMRIVTERAETANAWLAYIEVALFARQVKCNGILSDDLELCLKQQGVTISEIKRRALTLHKVLKKGKGKKVEEAPAAKGSSADPVGYSTDKQVELSRAADERAKLPKSEEDPMLKMVMPNWTSKSKENHLKVLLGAAVVDTKPNENGVFVEGTEFEFELNKAASISISLASRKGEWAYGYRVTGCNGGGGRGPWESDMVASREAAINHAAREVIHHLKSKHSESKTEAKNRAELRFVAEFILNSTAQPVPAEAEKMVGIHDSKLGSPHLWNEDDIAVGAEGLAAKTMTITEMIGPKPKPAEKTAYNEWSRVQMKLTRAAKKIAG